MSSPFTAFVRGRHMVLRYFEGIACTTLIGALALSHNAFAIDPPSTPPHARHLAIERPRQPAAEEAASRVVSSAATHTRQCDPASHRMGEILLSVAKLTRFESSRATQIS